MVPQLCEMLHTLIKFIHPLQEFPTMITLSPVTKLDGIPSWSLESVRTCPGARITDGDRKGELVDAFSGCYAVGGNYRFRNVRELRVRNRRDWKRDGWVADMTFALDHLPLVPLV
jgi:hypothetical protein